MLIIIAAGLVCAFAVSHFVRTIHHDRALPAHAEGSFDVLLHEQIEDRVRTIVFAPRERLNPTNDQMQQLRIAARYYSDFLKRYEARPDLNHDVIRVLQYSGIIFHVEHHFEEAIQNYRKSISQINGLLKPSHEMRSLRAMSRILLANAAADSGRDDLALEMLDLAISEYIELKADGSVLVGNLELSIAYRNKAILLASYGKDNREEIELSRSTGFFACGAANGRDGTFENLIDTYHIEAAFQTRRGEDTKAEKTLRICIKMLEGFLNDLSNFSQYEDLRLPKELYVDKLRVLKHHLSQTMAPPSDEPSTLVTSGWSSTMLSFQQGITFSMDRFFNAEEPAEFEHQDVLLLSWHDWAADALTQTIQAVSERMRIIVLVQNQRSMATVRETLRDRKVNLDHVHLAEVPTNTIWIRDYGPTSVQTSLGKTVWLDTSFSNFETAPHFENDEIPRVLARNFDVPLVTSPISMEAGELLTNGEGLALLSQSIIDRNLRLGFTRDEIHETLKRLWSVKTIVEIKPLLGESTNHIDWLTTFPRPDVVVVGEYGSDDLTNQAVLDSTADRLSGLSTRSGRLKVVRIPMPPRADDFYGGTYTNVLYANGLLIVPSWQNSSKLIEDRVRQTYQELLPGWDIQLIDSTSLGRRGGAIHCLSKTVRLPASSLQRIFGDS